MIERTIKHFLVKVLHSKNVFMLSKDSFSCHRKISDICSYLVFKAINIMILICKCELSVSCIHKVQVDVQRRGRGVDLVQDVEIAVEAGGIREVDRGQRVVSVGNIDELRLDARCSGIGCGGKQVVNAISQTAASLVFQ